LLYPANCVAGFGVETNTTHNIDCVEGMKLLPDNCIDLTVTSPPYDNLRTYNGFEWDFEEIAKELYRVTKQGGVVVWIVGDATIKGSETGTSFKQALFFKERGFNLHDTMIWQKSGMLPTQDRYYNIFEYMFVFSKGKPKTMNFICDHKTTAGGRVQKKDACINKGKQKDGVGTFVRSEYSRRPNIWKISIGKNKETQGHPAPFPEQLAKDHIITWSNEGDIVLDPFMGSGTTAKMALMNNRKYIGFEISKEYCEIANERVDNLVKEMEGDAEC
jgi:site-specific DNA-methyltransferase (adenine-specific)